MQLIPAPISSNGSKIILALGIFSILIFSGYVARDASKVAALHPEEYKSVSYSGVADLGDSKLLRPEWSARPVAFEGFYVVRSVISKTLPNQSLKRQVFAAAWMWISGWLLIVAGASYLLTQRKLALGTVMILCASITYAYYFFAFRPTVLPYDLPAAAIVTVLIYLSFRLMQLGSNTKWSILFGACILVAAITKESTLVVPGALAIILVRRTDTKLLALTAGLIIAAVMLRTLYSSAIGIDSIWSYRSTVDILSDNIEAVRGINWEGVWYRNPALYFLVFIPVFTPLVQRSTLKSEQVLLLRLALVLFIIGTVTLGQIRESRILLEWALPMAVMIVAALTRGAPTPDERSIRK